MLFLFVLSFSVLFFSLVFPSFPDPSPSPPLPFPLPVFPPLTSLSPYLPFLSFTSLPSPYLPFLSLTSLPSPPLPSLRQVLTFLVVKSLVGQGPRLASAQKVGKKRTRNHPWSEAQPWLRQQRFVRNLPQTMLFLSSVAYFLILLYSPNYEIFEYIIFLHSLSKPKALSVYCDKEEEMYWTCCKQSTFETPEHNSLIASLQLQAWWPSIPHPFFFAGRGGVSRTWGKAFQDWGREGGAGGGGQGRGLSEQARTHNF